MKYKIVIVDDHLLIAKALGSIIQNFAEFDVLYEAENGRVLLEKLRSPVNIPDIVLMDISMPEMNGFETTAALTEKYPQISVIALSMQNDDESLLKMVKAGAKGYLLKNIQPAELENALKTVIDKGIYFPAWATSRVFSSLTNKTQPTAQTFKLNDRELEFLKYTCTELTYKEIADRMNCSPRTVEGYRDSLFEKLDVKTRVGLAIYAIRNKICQI